MLWIKRQNAADEILDLLREGAEGIIRRRRSGRGVRRHVNHARAILGRCGEKFEAAQAPGFVNASTTHPRMSVIPPTGASMISARLWVIASV